MEEVFCRRDCGRQAPAIDPSVCSPMTVYQGCTTQPGGAGTAQQEVTLNCKTPLAAPFLPLPCTVPKPWLAPDPRSQIDGIPWEVVLLTVKRLDAQSRSAWRLVNREFCQTVYETTSRLSCHRQGQRISTLPSELLGRCKGLVELRCNGRGLSYIPGLPAALEVLDIDGAHLRDVSPLGQCTALKHLRLVKAWLEQQDIPQHLPSVLTQLTALQSLDLSNNFLKERQAQALGPALATLTTLQRLDLSCNKGLGINEALAPAIRQLTNLQHLNLSAVGIGDAATLAPALCHLSQLQHLDLSKHSILSNAAALAPAIRRLSRLQQLHLSDSVIGANGMMLLAPALQQLTGLVQLDLGSSGLGPAGAILLAPALHQLTGLQVLDLSANRLTQAGAPALAPAISGMLGLQRLYLRNNHLGREGVMDIASTVQHLHGIKLLDLQRNNLSTSAEAAAITLSIQKQCPQCRVYLS